MLPLHHTRNKGAKGGIRTLIIPLGCFRTKRVKHAFLVQRDALFAFLQLRNYRIALRTLSYLRISGSTTTSVYLTRVPHSFVLIGVFVFIPYMLPPR